MLAFTIDPWTPASLRGWRRVPEPRLRVFATVTRYWLVFLWKSANRTWGWIFDLLSNEGRKG